jgi:hypothetical protein
VARALATDVIVNGETGVLQITACQEIILLSPAGSVTLLDLT